MTMAENTLTTPVSNEPRQTSRPPEPRSRMRWIIAGAAIVLVVIGVLVWRYLGTYESTDDAQVDGHLNPISARVSGYVTKINIEDNQYVQKGTTLIEIDPRDYQVAVDRAKAELADAEATAQAAGLNVPLTSVGTGSQLSSAEADVPAAQAAVEAAEHQVEAARAQVAAAEADNARSQADLARYRDLVAKDEVSRQVFDHADATAKADTALLDATHHALAVAEQQVKEAQGRLAQSQASLANSRTGPQQVAVAQAHARAAQAMVEQKKAALEKAQLDLQYCSIVAPIDGVVRKTVELGMNVEAGQPLLAIASLDDVWITANFKETQLQRMKPGQRVTITADAYSREYRGHVDSISGASGARFSLLPPENATGNYVKVVQRVPVKIVLDPGQNSDHSLRLGMSVTPKVWF